MAITFTPEKKAYMLGFAEGYAMARDRGADLRDGDPRPREERVTSGQDWKQGRKDGYKAGMRDREENLLFDHSLHVELGEPQDWLTDKVKSKGDGAKPENS